MKITVLLNCAAGTLQAEDGASFAEDLTALFATHDVQADVQAVPAEELCARVRDAVAAGVDAVVVGGGDGTLGCAANELVGGPVPLGVLPLGTLNHFAKDLGVPLDMKEAVRAIAERHVRAVDVGEVNGHIFLNNSSIGLYPKLVRAREQEQNRQGYGKWTAMAHAAVKTLRRLPVMSVRLLLPDGERRLRTSFVFIGNNPYDVTLFELGTRQTLESGALCLYTARETSPGRLFRSALRTVIRRPRTGSDFEQICATAVGIETGDPEVGVSLDGEVRRLETPLRYRIRPTALRVLVPQS